MPRTALRISNDTVSEIQRRAPASSVAFRDWRRIAINRTEGNGGGGESGPEEADGYRG